MCPAICTRPIKPHEVVVRFGVVIVVYIVIAISASGKHFRLGRYACCVWLVWYSNRSLALFAMVAQMPRRGNPNPVFRASTLHAILLVVYRYRGGYTPPTLTYSVPSPLSCGCPHVVSHPPLPTPPTVSNLSWGAFESHPNGRTIIVLQFGCKGHSLPESSCPIAYC